jgi:hypothetical protein
LPILAFFIFHIYSSIFPSERLVWSLKYTLRFFGLGLVFFIVINFIEDRKQLNCLLNCLFAGAGSAAIFALIQFRWPYLLSDIQNFFDDAVVGPNRIRGLFGWYTNMAVYLGTFLPLILSCLIYKPAKIKSPEKIFYVFLILIIIPALILSHSRGWVFGLSMGLSTLWVLHLIKTKEYPIIWITLVILVIGISIFFNFRLDKFIMTDLEATEIARIDFAKEALTMIGRHPIRGIGADMFYWTSSFHNRTHNILLETAVNLGVFGLLILTWFFYKIFALIAKGVSKDSDFKNYYIQVGIICSLVSFLGHCQVDYFWMVSEVIGLFWILVGIGVCAYNLRQH